MRICPKCKQPPSDPQLVACERCKLPFVEQGIEQALPLTEADLDRVVSHVAESLATKDLERLAKHIKRSLTEDDWKSLAEKLVRHINIVEDSEKFAKRLLGSLLVVPRFWIIVVATIALLLFVIMEFGGHVAKEKAVELFNAEMTNQIRVQFQEPRISNIIVSVASENATNLMN